MPALLRLVCLLFFALCLKGCAPLLAVAGYHQTVVQVVAQVERIKLAGDGVSFVASSKTINDHLLSTAVGKDCKVFNVISRDPVCKTRDADPKSTASAEPATNPPPATESVTAIPDSSPLVLSHTSMGD